MTSSPSVISPTLAHVLVVEDDPDTRDMLRYLLHSSGYVPIVAESGEAALVALDREPVDAVVLDLRLPGMSGFEVCERIRLESASYLPILMVTANREREHMLEGLNLGADDYLVKPFVPDELLGRLQALLRRNQAAATLVTENEALRAMLERTRSELAGVQSVSEAEGTLRRELTHNVATHLSALCAVIESEYRRAPLGPAREVAQRILGRVRGAALVYETSDLLQEEPVRFDQLVATIATALKHIYSPRRRLPLQIDGGALEVPLVAGAPLAMIANELITNCYKHAFPDQRFGSVTIRYNRSGADLLLEVVDDGVGFPVRVDRLGRGQQTVSLLASQLNGEATWESGPGGTTATVQLKDLWA